MAFGCYKFKDQILVNGPTRPWMVCSLPLQPHLEPCFLCFASSVPAMLTFTQFLKYALFSAATHTLHMLFLLYHLLSSWLFLFIYISPLSLFFQESLFHLSAYVIPSIRISNCHHRSNSTFLLSNPLESLSSHYCIGSILLGLCLLLLTIVT